MKKTAILILCSALLFVFTSCDLAAFFDDQTGTTVTTGKSLKEQTGTSVNETEETENTGAESSGTTEAATTQTKAESGPELYLNTLGELKEQYGNDGSKAFLYNILDEGVLDMFVTYAVNGRGLCTVYTISNGTVIRRINSHEIFSGSSETYCVGIAVKENEKYLYTYSKTRAGSEYTSRYEFIGLSDRKTATVAEDYRRKDPVTGNSVHEYTVNGEACFESDYIRAREAYTIKLTTAEDPVKGAEKTGVTFDELAAEIMKAREK